MTMHASRFAALGALVLAVWLPSCVAKTAADYYVHSLPGAPAGEPLRRMHAGHIEVSPEHHGNLFFWHFANRHIADKSRTVIWLNGGPGCSSEDGALMEVGPYRVNPDGTLRINEGSWDEFANVLFVDQPVGTGFSYVDSDSYLKDLTVESEQFIVFLEKFFELFPESANDDLYLAGESFAGQHIPYISRAILDRNKNAKHKWNLAGLMIGNGWISGLDQYPTTLQFAYDHGVLERGSESAKAAEKQHMDCMQDLSDRGEDVVETPKCEAILLRILDASTHRPENKGKCVNMYDFRLIEQYPSCGMTWPPDLKQMTPYLRQTKVLEALNINKDKKTGWVECAGSVSAAFRNTKSKPAKRFLPDLLAELPILLFSGDKDIICNHVGTEELINSLTFNGGKGLEVEPGVWAPRLEWTFENEPAGYYQTARNLTYLLFYNSSHMVPFDYPRRTRDMADRFMGVDIASIGGKPADSRIDGLQGVQTSVGGHTNSTAAVEAEKTRLKAATHHAYYKSGQVVLIVVLIAAGVWAWVVWRGRVARRGRGGVAYSGLPGRGDKGDVEAVDFDEAELDDLAGRESRDEFHVGDDSDEESDRDHGHDRRGKGKAT